MDFAKILQNVYPSGKDKLIIPPPTRGGAYSKSFSVRPWVHDAIMTIPARAVSSMMWFHLHSSNFTHI